MGWDDAGFAQELEQAVDAFDHALATALCDRLLAHLADGDAVSTTIARKILGTLRRKCYFDLMEVVADGLRAAGVDDDRIRRQYAQALIDQGKSRAAAYVLELLDHTTTDPVEKAEARGLLGRIDKQAYVNATNADPAAATKPLQRRSIERALRAYGDVYRSGPSSWLWHGINTVALAERAKRDHLTIAGAPDGLAIANAILSVLEARATTGALEVFDLATAGEACVALGRIDGALTWFGRYVLDQRADAFELSSTERQLREVWGLTIDKPPGSVLLPLLQANILLRKGGKVTLQPSTLAPVIARTKEASQSPKLEKILGRDGVVTLKWYLDGLERSRTVAQVRTATGEGFGTGFLVRGRDIVPDLGDELLLLTNAHVVSDDPVVQQAKGSLPPDDAAIVFEALEPVAGKEFRVAKLVWTSPPGELDASLLRLDPPIPAATTAPLAAAMPLADGQQKVYVVGHPGGRSLSFSLQDNLLLDYDERLIHYRSPTEGGSSGSPVFNQQWKLIGLHHAGGFGVQRLNGKDGTYDANEGIQMKKIIEAAQKGR